MIVAHLSKSWQNRSRESDGSAKRPVSVLLLFERPGKPTHVHVGRDRKTAKFWLEPVRLEYNLGFATNELNKISALVQQHQAELVKAWHDYFKSGNGNRGGQAR